MYVYIYIQDMDQEHMRYFIRYVRRLVEGVCVCDAASSMRRIAFSPPVPCEESVDVLYIRGRK